MGALITKFLTPFLLILVFAVGAYEFGERHPIAAPTVYYSLDAKQNDQQIISVIGNAHKYIYFAIYEFTKDNIAQALIAAKEKGIDVEGVLDRDNSTAAEEAPIVKELEAAGIKIETQIHTDGIMHIKAIVTDNEYASGSYNWTASATNVNDEILEVGTDENTLEQYQNILKNLLSVNATGAGTPAYEDLSKAPAVAGVPAEGAIDYTDAKNHIGETTAVSGQIERVYISSSGQVFFDYCSNYKTCPFSAVIFADDAKNFTDVSQYEGETITVTGPVKSYNGTPEIVISSPDQISK